LISLRFDSKDAVSPDSARRSDGVTGFCKLCFLSSPGWPTAGCSRELGDFARPEDGSQHESCQISAVRQILATIAQVYAGVGGLRDRGALGEEVKNKRRDPSLRSKLDKVRQNARSLSDHEPVVAVRATELQSSGSGGKQIPRRFASRNDNCLGD
jgi:hypothetical protein